MPKISKVVAASPVIRRKKKVAAYARVSMDSANLLHSLSAQVSYYSGLIQKNPEWTYAGVYADEAITGTSTKNRTEFNRMVEDCEEGKIDLILVKSISRFARNTIDTLTTVRHLKDIGVEVRFEREGISTFSGDGELMLTILASYAQEESESISRNEKWAVRKRFERGIPSTSLRCFGYDWDSENKTLIINEEEAGWVRYIYDRYLDGASIKSLEKELKEKGVTALRGENLARTTIRRILTSRLYTGDVVLQQYYMVSVGKAKRNLGELPQYEVEENHEPIVSKEEFERVQERISRRAENADNHGYEKTRFAGLVKCGKCGYACNHVKHQRGGKIIAKIECNRRRTKQCDLLPIKEVELEKIVGEVVTAKDTLEKIILSDDHIDFHLKGGKVRSRKRGFPKGGYMNSCFSRRTFCGECGGTAVRMKSGKRMCWICSARKSDRNCCENRVLPETEFIEAGKWATGTDENFDMKYYCKVEKADIYKDRIVFTLREGGTRVWQRR